MLYTNYKGYLHKLSREPQGESSLLLSCIWFFLSFLCYLRIGLMHLRLASNWLCSPGWPWTQGCAICPGLYLDGDRAQGFMLSYLLHKPLYGKQRSPVIAACTVFFISCGEMGSTMFCPWKVIVHWCPLFFFLLSFFFYYEICISFKEYV